MPAYATLFRFTKQGMGIVKELPARVQALRKQAEASGGRIVGIWFTQGQYDGVIIWEAPDEDAATRAILQVGMNGNFRTETMRAFSEADMERILKGMS